MQLVDVLRARKPALADAKIYREPSTGTVSIASSRRRGNWPPPEQRRFVGPGVGFRSGTSGRLLRRHDLGCSPTPSRLTGASRGHTVEAPFSSDADCQPGTPPTWASGATGSAHEWYATPSPSRTHPHPENIQRFVIVRFRVCPIVSMRGLTLV